MSERLALELDEALALVARIPVVVALEDRLLQMQVSAAGTTTCLHTHRLCTKLWSSAGHTLPSEAPAIASSYMAA